VLQGKPHSAVYGGKDWNPVAWQPEYEAKMRWTIVISSETIDDRLERSVQKSEPSNDHTKFAMNPFTEKGESPFNGWISRQ
jgi:hypothetical protein